MPAIEMPDDMEALLKTLPPEQMAHIALLTAMKAAESAAHAATRIERHEAECLLRWNKVDTMLEQARGERAATARKITELYNRWWTAASATIALLLGVLGVLVLLLWETKVDLADVPKPQPAAGVKGAAP